MGLIRLKESVVIDGFGDIVILFNLDSCLLNLKFTVEPTLSTSKFGLIQTGDSPFYTVFYFLKFMNSGSVAIGYVHGPRRSCFIECMM